MRRNDSYEWMRSIILKVTADPHVQEKFWALLIEAVEKEREEERQH